MLVIEWFQRNKEHGLDIGNLHPIMRYCIIIAIFELIIFFLPATPSQFIYFQF